MSSEICIGPIFRGGGTKLKLLEYAAAGRPVVATYKAIEGLNMVNGVNGLFHSEVNEAFLESIRSLLSDEKLSKEIGENNKKLSREFDWNSIGQKLFSKYLELINCS